MIRLSQQFSKLLGDASRADDAVRIEVVGAFLCVAAFLTSFLVPLNRGMPIGDRQLGQYVPDAVVSLLAIGARAVFALVVLLGVLLIVRNPERPDGSRRIVIAVGMVGAAVALGAFRGLIGDSEPRYALAHGQFVVAYAVALGMRPLLASEWRRVVGALRVVLTLPAALSFVVLLLNGANQPAWYTNILPTGTSFGGVACLLWWAHARSTRLRRYYALAGLGAFGVLVSSLRAWAVALVLGCVLFAVIAPRSSAEKAKMSWRGMLSGGALVVVAVAVSLRLVLSSSLRMKYIDRTVQEFSGDSLRARQLRNLLAEWSQSPLFGSGLGYRNPDLARLGPPLDVPRPYIVELSYFNFLAKLGIVGFGLLVGGMALMLWHLRSDAKRRAPDPVPAAMFASTVYLLLASIANPVFESLYVHLFFALALVGTLTVDESLGPHWSWRSTSPAGESPPRSSGAPAPPVAPGSEVSNAQGS